MTPLELAQLQNDRAFKHIVKNESFWRYSGMALSQWAVLSKHVQVNRFLLPLSHSLLSLLASIVSFEQILCHVAYSSAINSPAHMFPSRLLIPWYSSDPDSTWLWTNIKKLSWPEECFNKSPIVLAIYANISLQYKPKQLFYGNIF